MSWRFLAAGLIFWSLPRAWAHDPGLSTGHAEIQSKAIVVEVTFSSADLVALHPPASIDADWIRRLFLLQLGNASTAARGARVQPAPTPGEYQFQLIFPRPDAGGNYTLAARRLGDLPPGHRQYIAVSDARGAQLAEKLLVTNDPVIAFSVAPIPAGGETTPNVPAPLPSHAAIFWEFLRLGMTHIGTGYDHLLFLFGLLLVCRTFRGVVRIVTCFTVAHALTLALATCNLVHISHRLVAPAIALSILCVGGENLWYRGAEPPRRWLVTCIFGLIHGFGFTTVLRDLGLGTTTLTLALPLFSFNLGVEIGQVALSLAILPLLWWLRKIPQFMKTGMPLFSGMVAFAGMYWFIERIFTG